MRNAHSSSTIGTQFTDAQEFIEHGCKYANIIITTLNRKTKPYPEREI